MIFFRFLRSNWIALTGAVVLSICSASLTLIILRQINDLASQRVGDPTSRVVQGVSWLAILFVVSASSQYLSSRLGANLVSQLRADLSQRFLDAQFEHLWLHKSQLLSAFIEDVAQISPLVIMIPLFAYNLMVVMACALYLYLISSSLFGILSLGLIIPLATSGWLIWNTRLEFVELRRSEQSLFEYIRAIGESKKETSLNPARGRHFTRERLKPAIEKTQREMAQVYLKVGLNQSWSSATMYLALFIVIYTSKIFYKMDEGQIFGFVIGSFFLFGPINFLIQSSLQVAKGMASLRHLRELGVEFEPNLALRDKVDQAAAGRTVWHEIIAEQITYIFPNGCDGQFVLGPIDLNVRKGELLFIVGGNGSGKSTLLLLLCGLLRPTTGRLLIDGIDIAADPRSYRALFSGVFSDFFLFNHVINGFGVSPSDDEISRLLARFRLETDVTATRGELSQVALSTGQRKRLALLQSVAEDRDILFFDEWAADQDPSFRSVFYNEFLAEFKEKGKTVIVISHDERFFHLADRVLRLQRGMLVQNDRTCANYEES